MNTDFLMKHGTMLRNNKAKLERLDLIESKLKERDIICFMLFGSQFYGTATLESDYDYKGVFMPTKEEIYLGRIPKNISIGTKLHKDDKNIPEDVDVELFSFHEFMKLACQGQTIPLDMLYAPENMILRQTGLWEELVGQSHKFHTKNLSAFVGYARRQSAKYGIKGSRLNDAKKVLDFLGGIHKGQSYKLKEYWNCLPKGEHIHKLAPNPEDTNQRRLYQVCGKKIDESASVVYAYDIIKRFYDAYGARAKQAAENKGIDWKAISHALRAAIEVKQILTEGKITFPLEQAGYLRNVKQGKLDYTTEVAPNLEARMEELEELAKASDLPDKVDRKYWDKFTFDMIEGYIFEVDTVREHRRKHG